jgi:hypothetical protein
MFTTFSRDFGNRTEWRNEHGQIHRLDGPAIIWMDDLQYWWVNGYHVKIY